MADPLKDIDKVIKDPTLSGLDLIKHAMSMEPARIFNLYDIDQESYKQLLDSAMHLGRDELITDLVNHAVHDRDPWFAAYAVAWDWLSVATIQWSGHNPKNPQGIVTCACGERFRQPKQYMAHNSECRAHEEESMFMEDIVPTHPSNRSFVEQLEKWGCTVVNRKRGMWRMRFPAGQTIDVQPPTSHSGNPASAFIDACKYLQVSPAAFWAGPVDKKAPKLEVVKPEAEKDPAMRGRANMVYDLLVGQGRPMSLGLIAEHLGITREGAGSACSYLASKGFIERVKSGVYKALESRPADFRAEVDVNVGTSPAEPPAEVAVSAPESAPEPVSSPADPEPQVSTPPAVSSQNETTHTAADIDGLMETVLDLLFPGGMNIKASDLKAILAWQEATKELLRRVRGA